MASNDEFSDLLRSYFVKCGYSKRLIKKLSLDTRLYHDLRIYGDIAESYIEVLSEQFGVDISNFEFHTYFPEEYPVTSVLGAVLIPICPFWVRRRYLHPDKNFKPLTMRMIQKALANKKWEDEENGVD